MSGFNLTIGLSQQRRHKSGAHAKPVRDMLVEVTEDCLYGPYGLGTHKD